MKSRKITILILTIALTLSNTVLSFAGNQAPRNCSNINTFTVKLNSRISEKESSFLITKSAQIKKLSSLQTRQNQKLEMVLEKQTQNIAFLYAKLEILAKTDYQKQTINNFKLSVDAAIKTRRSAIDAANSIFRNTVNKLIIDRQEITKNLINDFKEKNIVTLEKARVACINGEPLINLRSNLLGELRNSKETFTTEIRNIGNLKFAIEPLVKTNRNSIKLAEENFKHDLESARLTLKSTP